MVSRTVAVSAVVGVAVLVAVGVWAGSGSDDPAPGPRRHVVAGGPSAASSAVPPTVSTPAPSVVRQRNKVVVLDPGHSAGRRAVVDRETGLVDRYYPNYPELNDVWDVALLVKRQLEAHGGFTVLLTKKTAGQNATYRQRADVANAAHADLGVSIHDQGGLPSQGGLPFSSANNEVYDQAVGMYAQSRSTGRRTTFDDKQIASLSARYARDFVRQRAEAEGHRVHLAFGTPNPRDANTSDIWLVQLFARMPWIYNEAGGYSRGATDCGRDGTGRRIPDGACLSEADKRRYATGISNSVIAALS